MYHPELSSFRRRIAQARTDGDLYFASLLDRETILSVFSQASGILDAARIYSTAVTLWVFLSQVLSIDHGCVAAVAKLVTYRCARGLGACSAESGAYCIARDKLDETAMHRLLAHTGQAIEAKAPDHWLWLRHRVVVADGTTITMADTKESRAQSAEFEDCDANGSLAMQETSSRSQ